MSANEEIAGIFDRMARVLAFHHGDRFRILAYERGATAVRGVDGESLQQMAREGTLDEIPAIGKDLASMIGEYLRTGHIRKFDNERRGLSDEFIDLMSVPGLGPKTLSLLHSELQINSLEDLKRAIDSGAMLNLPGFREKKVENIRRSLDLWLAGKKRMPLGVALPIAEELLAAVAAMAEVAKADLAGSLRRRRETIGDIDMLIVSKNPASALRTIARHSRVRQVLGLGDTKATLLLDGGIQMDVRAIEPESYGAALQYFTGSKEHNVHLRTIARRRGLKISEYGVFRGKRRIAGREEVEVYKTLDLPLIPPELREDRGEIEAAQEGRLPCLIELRDLRGEFHAHTTYSDGRNTIAEMVEAAAGRGYEYIALSDHSPSQRIARGLDRGRLEEKLEEIARLRKDRRTRKPRILAGAEVDILPDGSLDYPDDILALLDVVIGAVHGSFRQTPATMTGRLLDALDHPHLHILAHPTARLMGTREAIRFDFEKVVVKAAERRVALELNGSFLRLDLNDVMARTAQSAGAHLVIGSDAHSTAQLDFVRYGVYQARRGWIQPSSLVNTWPWNRVQQWLRGHPVSAGRQSGTRIAS